MTSAVQPVWGIAPSPAPVSPWKYSGNHSRPCQAGSDCRRSMSPRLEQRGLLECPIIGVAHADWTRERLVCRSGRRACYATRILLQNGFDARVLSGGMLSHLILSSG